MNNAVIYARYSSYNQTEQSIEGQIHICEEFAKKNGYTIIDSYIDRAMSGTKDNRPAFQKMINDSKSKTFDYIIVYKLDRFSRNKYDNVVYKHKLAQQGVKVVSATEIISDTPEGLLMEGLLEMFAEMYSKELSQKVKRGIRESLIKNNFIGGHILYGYKVVDKKLIINDEQAKVIKYIFEQYANGMAKVDIVKNLNEMGYRTNAGKKFTVNSFQHTLSNTKYIGELTINGVKYENYCPAIIDKETFKIVQEKLKENRHYSARRKAEEVFLLTGKAYCGHCGANLVGISGTSHTNKRHSYYVCSNRYKNKCCNKKYEKKGYLEWYLVNEVKEKLKDEQLCENIAKRLVESYENSNIKQQIKDYDIKIKNIEKEIDLISDKIVQISNIDVIHKLEAKANDLSELKENYKVQQTKLIMCIKFSKSEEEITKMLKIFATGNALDFDYQKRIIDTFVDKVYIYDDKFVAYFNLLNIEQISYVEMLEDVKEIEKNLGGFLYNSYRTAMNLSIRTIMVWMDFFVLLLN